MADESDYLCRETSLIAFNRRVLAQAADESVPLLERLKFLCIVSSNLDEFFEVRIASLTRLLRAQGDIVLQNGQTVRAVLKNAKESARSLIEDQYSLFNRVMLPALKNEGVEFLRRSRWTEAQTKWIEQYFKEQIRPVITPVGLDPSHPFPKLLNKSLNFVVSLDGQDAFGRHSKTAIIQAPRCLPRIVRLPPEISESEYSFVFLSSIVHANVEQLFLGMDIESFYQFRVTRDSDINLEDDVLNDLRSAIEDELHVRQYGRGVRLEVPTLCPEKTTNFLASRFDLGEDDVYRVDGPVNLVRLMSVPGMIDRPDLKYDEFVPAPHEAFAGGESVFDVLKRREVLLHHPYQSFAPVVDFLRQAADDPAVVSIKMTIYRTGSKSDLIKALTQAALNGKEVTVVVELMARFDEAANVNWAAQLEEAGAHVVYGVVGYKVHAKMLLVVRREGGELKRYAHLGTGNYHQGTSRLYTDYGFMTSDPLITADCCALFQQITGIGQAGHLNKMYQSPFTLAPMIRDRIQREIDNAKAGKTAWIRAKMNALIDPDVIQDLYRASQAGVRVDLVVRGMCALRPGVRGLSENIRVRSIVGRLLEHSRVYWFYDDGMEWLYISSADWMVRNLHHRVETCTPIDDRALKDRILRDSFEFPYKDNRQAWAMTPTGEYEKIEPGRDERPFNSQNALLKLYGAE